MIYLDNGATTRPFPNKYMGGLLWLNSHSSYSNGDEILWRCRERIARCINCEPSEIFFTNGGCESNTWCINMLYDMLGEKVKVSPNEHKSIMNNPRVRIESSSSPQYDSCMLVNNETGELYNKRSIHKDIVQGLGKVKVDIGELKDMGCMMCSWSGHKIHGEKGVGGVWVDKRMNEILQIL